MCGTCGEGPKSKGGDETENVARQDFGFNDDFIGGKQLRGFDNPSEKSPSKKKKRKITEKDQDFGFTDEFVMGNIGKPKPKASAKRRRTKKKKTKAKGKKK